MSDQQAQETRYGAHSLESSKGEHILKALDKLWMKMIQLQNARKVEKKDVQTSVSDTDNTSETLADVQYKLLEIQLKYIHKFLHKQMNKKSCNEDEHESDDNASPKSESWNMLYGDDNLDMIPVKLEKETQTSKGSSVLLSEEAQANATSAVQTDNSNYKETGESSQKLKNSEKLNIFEEPDGKKDLHKDVMPLEKEKEIDSARQSATHLKTCSHSHYHVKLSDVPFLIGKSTSASHSVIANVQNVIGLMKSHNKGLCVPSTENQKVKPCRKLHTPSQKPDSFKMQDMKAILKHLAEQLSNLTLKQEMLRRKLQASEQMHFSDEVYQEYNDISRLMECKAKEIADTHHKLKKVGADRLAQKLQSKKSLNRHCSVSKVPHSSKSKTIKNKVNVRGPTRQRVLRSVKQLKEQLQEEDIVWS